MHIINICAVLDKKLTKDKLYELGFVAPIYYREIPLTVNTTAPYVTPIDLKSCADYWELFICHYFLTYALECLLEGVLEVAGGSITGVSIPELIDSLIGPDFNVRLMRETGISAITPLGYLSWLGAEQIPPSRNDAQKYAQRGTLPSKFSEMKVIEHKCKTPGELTWKGFATIVRLYIRWRGRQSESGFIELSISAPNELWIGTLIPTLDALFAQNLSWKELAVSTIQPWILNQHDLVMYSKKRLDACWLHFEVGRVFKDQDYWPRVRNPRWANAISIMQDLGLIDVD